MRADLPEAVHEAIRRALAEDVGSGDVTTHRIVPEEARGRARLIARQDGVVAGLDVAAAVFHEFDAELSFRTMVEEGSRVEAGQAVAVVEGSVRSILTAERTALNFLGRMSGIASLTRRYVEAVASSGARILDTRKTAPGLRAVDKLAVLRGGGVNHRQGLSDMVLVKDNHVDWAGSLEEAVRRVRSPESGLEVEVETRSLEEVQAALASGVARIMLDNMDPAMMRQAVGLVDGRARLEASGTVSLANVGEIAATGVNDISIGALTHSAEVFDVGLEFVQDTRAGRSGIPGEPA